MSNFKYYTTPSDWSIFGTLTYKNKDISILLNQFSIGALFVIVIVLIALIKKDKIEFSKCMNKKVIK